MFTSIIPLGIYIDQIC